MTTVKAQREVDVVRHLKATPDTDELWAVVRDSHNTHFLQAVLLNKNLTTEIANFLWIRYWTDTPLATAEKLGALASALFKSDKVERDKLVTERFDDIYQYMNSYSAVKSSAHKVFDLITTSDITILRMTTSIEQLLHSAHYSWALSVARNKGLSIKDLVEAATNGSYACRRVLAHLRRDEAFAYAREMLGEGYENIPDEWISKINNWEWLEENA